MSATEPGNPRERELTRRIEDLEAREPEAFGRFTVWDWIVCTTFTVVLPIVALWWFAP